MFCGGARDSNLCDAKATLARSVVPATHLPTTGVKFMGGFSQQVANAE